MTFLRAVFRPGKSPAIDPLRRTGFEFNHATARAPILLMPIILQAFRIFVKSFVYTGLAVAVLIVAVITLGGDWTEVRSLFSKPGPTPSLDIFQNGPLAR